MSYYQDSIKEFILGSIYTNNIIPDCLEIIYKNIVTNIIDTYTSIDIIINLKPSIFELNILYMNNLNFCYSDLILFVLNNYIDGIEFIISKNIIQQDIIENINNLIMCSCELGNREILNLLYTNYNNYIIGYKWINNCVYSIVKYKHANILEWFKDNNITVYFDKIHEILFDNNYKMIINLYNFNINIISNPVDELINYIENKEVCYITLIDTVYEYLINNKYDEQWDDKIDYVIHIVVERGLKDVYKWIKTKGFNFSLESYDFYEENLVGELEMNWLYNTQDYNEDDYNYYNEEIYYNNYTENDYDVVELIPTTFVDLDENKQKTKIITSCLKRPYRRRNKKNYYSRTSIKKNNPSVYPKTYKPTKIKPINRR